MSGRRGTPAATIGNDKVTLDLNEEEAEYLFSPGAEDRMARANAAVDAAGPLMMKCHTDMQRGRMTTAHEAYKKALRIVQEALPEDSLVIADVQVFGLYSQLPFQPNGTSAQPEQGFLDVFAREFGAQAELTLPFGLDILRRRHAAGTLYDIRYDEQAWLNHEAIHYMAGGGGADNFMQLAARMDFWPPSVPAEIKASVLAEAVQIILEVERQEYAVRFCGRRVRGGLYGAHTAMHNKLCEIAVGLRVPTAWRSTFEAMPPMARADKIEVLQQLGATASFDSDTSAFFESVAEDAKKKAAADAAKHGLKRCALPDCGAQEAHPKAYKLCGRCRGVGYCCAEHATQDWKRHKKADGCKAPEAS